MDVWTWSADIGLPTGPGPDWSPMPKVVGDLSTGADDFGKRVGQMLQLIVATQEYQFA